MIYTCTSSMVPIAALILTMALPSSYAFHTQLRLLEGAQPLLIARLASPNATTNRSSRPHAPPALRPLTPLRMSSWDGFGYDDQTVKAAAGAALEPPAVYWD